MIRRKKKVLSIVCLAIAVVVSVSGSSAATKPTAVQVAAMLEQEAPRVPVMLKRRTDPAQTGDWRTIQDVVCRATGPKFSCAATFVGGNVYVPARVNLTVRVRAYKSPSVCASLTSSVPASCWSTKDGARDLEANGIDAYRQWLSGGHGLDQAGASCVGFGSGFFWCQDEPVGNEAVPTKRHTVVLGAGGRVRVTPR